MKEMVFTVMKKGDAILIILLFIFLFSGILLGFAAAFYITVNSRFGASEIEDQRTQRTQQQDSGKSRDVFAQKPEDKKTMETAPPTSSAIAPQRKIVLSFVGDCTLGQGYGTSALHDFSSVYKKNSKEYFFSGVRDVFASDDLTIVNLEGPLTKSTTMRDKPEEGPKYWFQGPPEYAGILSAGSVEIANLSNNHTRDFGEEGYKDTKTALAKAGVAYFGNDDILTRQVRGVSIGFFGLSASASARLIKARIAALREAGAQVIIASFHGGSSLISYTPSASQRNAAYAAIDNGATFVVEHHPHVLQGIERYKNGVIAYSLGNFCFGGSIYPKDKDTMIFQVEITKTPSRLLCSYRVIPASVSSRTDYNDFRPRVLSGDKALSVMEKITSLSEELNSASSQTPNSGIP
jgi:poly-gamma-glutamate synthesis protein (capsule biosynthesis protein)